jgi:DNA-binding HxlR family transcriptional regulator
VKYRHSEHLCPMFQAAMEVLGRPWNGLIMAALQDHGSLRYSEIRARLAAMGDRMLSARLKELEERGLVVRRVMPGPPVRVAYELSDVGKGFRDVELALSRWGSRFAPAQRPARGPKNGPRGAARAARTAP